MHSNYRQRGRNQNSSREIPPHTDFPAGCSMENEVGANPAWKEPSRMIVWVLWPLLWEGGVEGSCWLPGLRTGSPSGQRSEQGELFVGCWVRPSSLKEEETVDVRSAEEE